MIPCSCVGINTTWQCSARCLHCFYVRFTDLHDASKFHSLEEMQNNILVAKNAACNRVTFIGEGEPTLHKNIKEIIEYCSKEGMYSNIITNALQPTRLYDELFKLGLNHLQISCHGLGDTLDSIMQVNGASAKQLQWFKWMNDNNKPFRSNTTLQQLNYKQLPEIANFLIDKGAFHISLLGFLPHYQWKDHSAEVAVHPEVLRPYIEEAARKVIKAGKLLTIRYHPFCHLDKELWPYITNALYVPFDPMEWFYNTYTADIEKTWETGLSLANVGVKGEPCTSCEANVHCGGWNKTSVDSFNGANLKCINGLTLEEKIRGYFFDNNPTNSNKGYV